MRPTRRHSATSSHSGLYALPSLCAQTAAPSRPTSGSGLSLALLSRPVALWDPGEAHRLHPSSSFPDDTGLRLSVRVSGAPNLPHPPIAVGRPFRGLTTVRFRCDLSICSPSCRSRPGFHPAHQDFYSQASGGLVTLTAAGYNYGVNWTSSTGGTFTR
jgi:hypothetical protein